MSDVQKRNLDVVRVWRWETGYSKIGYGLSFLRDVVRFLWIMSSQLMSKPNMQLYIYPEGGIRGSVFEDFVG